MVFKRCFMTVPICTADMSATSISQTQGPSAKEIVYVKECRAIANMGDILDTNSEDTLCVLTEWKEVIVQGCTEFMTSPNAIADCLLTLHAFLYVGTCYKDNKINIEMMADSLGYLLNVFTYYTKHEDLKICHKICFKIVDILVSMSGRIEYGGDEIGNQFSIMPHTICPIEKVLSDMEDWTQTNQVQYQLHEDDRVLMGEALHAYLKRLIADEQGWRSVFELKEGKTIDSDYEDNHKDARIDVKCLLQWVEAGMFFSKNVYDDPDASAGSHVYDEYYENE